MSQITTHVLDTASGKPAAGIKIALYQSDGNGWRPLAEGITNTDGRIAGLLPKHLVLHAGVYKMEFLVKDYFDRQGLSGFYPYVPIIFEISSAEHYHIPLLLSPFGYTTYRGS